MDDGKKELEELKKQLKELKGIVAITARDLRHVAQKYFPEMLPIRLPLQSFLELLAVKSRKIGYEKAMEEVLKGALRSKFDVSSNKIYKAIRKQLHECVYIPVLVRPNNEASIIKYRAIALRGEGMRYEKGVSPEDAYESVRREIIKFASKNPELLLPFNKNLIKDYDSAKFMKEDVVADFRVVVRIIEEEHADGS